MKEEHLIKQHGRDYVLFSGLVAEAHEKFLTWSLTADLAQTSTEDKPRVTAYFHGDYLAKDGEIRTITTTGIGTAGRATDRRGPAADAPVEMAETRAKARALRVAVNIGETAFEEIPTTLEHSSPGEAEAEEGLGSHLRVSEPTVKGETLRQLRFLADTFSEARGEDEEEHWRSFTDNLSYDPKEMSEAEAKKWISRYQRGLKKLEQASTPASS